MSHRLETFYLLADRELAGQALHGSWYATATNASGLAQGKFSVAVESTPTSLLKL
jgi:hypothetical protein